MRIALFSTDPVWEDQEASFAAIETYVAFAQKAHAQLAVFPEMTLTGFSMNISKIAEPASGSWTVRQFAALAKKYKTALVFGVVLRSGRKATNEAVWVDVHGKVRARYAKKNLFAYAQEDRHYTKGTKTVTLQTPGARFGFSVCFDLRFPETYLSMNRSCQALLNIANWPSSRIAHWRSLLEARAMENQAYMIGVNRTGLDGNGLVYVKSSAVFGPDGQKLEPVMKEKEMDVYELDFEALKQYRRRFPFYGAK